MNPELARKLFAQSCEFVHGSPSADNLPAHRLPEIAFVGRSNVGKSSLLNALVNRRTLARVSNTPGRTRQINLFRLGDTLMLVDLPGYGYARASKTLAAEWQSQITAYLATRPNLRRVILLIDARRGIMPIDREAMALLDRAAISYLPVLTKTDKLKAAERTEVTNHVAAEVGKHPAAFPEIIATSAEKGDGIEALRMHLAALAHT
ncbi:MAG TPA: ribosome biogenesis GTP-binding protein YihA/YsxC [Rhizomicrobium sp.]|nr:ribosome biogenesis GTP-binding protein YihA/YsxC [Rhizomicrobium sp.]